MTLAISSTALSLRVSRSFHTTRQAARTLALNVPSRRFTQRTLRGDLVALATVSIAAVSLRRRSLHRARLHSRCGLITCHARGSFRGSAKSVPVEETLAAEEIEDDDIFPEEESEYEEETEEEEEEWSPTPTLKQLLDEKPKPFEADNLPETVDAEEFLFGNRIPFSELGIEDQNLLAALDKLGYTHSTRVQAASIPMVLAKDRRAVVLSAETGSGKTLAYLVPALELILRMSPRPEGCRGPRVLILVPGLELGVQVAMVAEQLIRAVRGSRTITVCNSRRGWPDKAPDILIATPRAAAQGLEPCASEDEIARKEALQRINHCELVVMDEADLLLGGGSTSADIRAILTAMAAALPERPREVLPEAQVYYHGGVPVEVLKEGSLDWIPGKAFANPDGTFRVKLADEYETILYYVSRSRLRGPGIGLLVENGPRFMACCATLPSYRRSCYVGGKTAGIQNNLLYNSGIGSPHWVLKRWYPNALRIESEFVHRRHPCILQQDWIYIRGERKGDREVNIRPRILKTLEILKEQGPDVRTLIFAHTPASCLQVEQAFQNENIQSVSLHAGIPFQERLENLKKFGTGQVSVMICTDIAARGLDLPVCRHVIQLQFARNTVDHLHRVGRAARAGRLSKTTNLWGAGDKAVRDAVKLAPAMGLDGQVLTRAGNRCRMRRTRRKQKKQEFAYGEIREKARLARLRTQSKR